MNARWARLVAFTVTFLVFHVVRSKLLGWCMFGPRGLTSARVAKLSVLFPLAYMIFTAIRGPLSSDFYPYPFTDVHALGYLRVSVNALWVALLFVAIAAAATALDGKLPGAQIDRRAESAR